MASKRTSNPNAPKRALEEPPRRIAINAGQEGSVIVDAVKRAQPGQGYDALRGDFANMLERGIIDPAKVTRSALENAASVAAMVLTTESLITDLPEKAGAMPGMPPGGKRRGPLSASIDV